MTAHQLLGFFVRWRRLLPVVLLQFSLIHARAAEKVLAPGHVPAVVAQGKVARLGRLSGSTQMRLALSLPLRDPAGLNHLLAAIYNPASPEYHHYLTPREFAARFGPAPEDYAAVIRFARTNGLAVAATYSNRLVLDVTGRVSDVEGAFHVKLYQFRHPREARTFFAPDSEPSVDSRIPLSRVSGLDDYFRPHPNDLPRPGTPPRQPGSPQGGSGPSGLFMGNDFRQAYVPGAFLTGAGQSVGLVQFDDFFSADITNYENAIGLTNNRPQLVRVPVDDGVSAPGAYGTEVALDIEMVLSMSPGVSNIFVYEAPSLPFVDMLTRMAEDDSSSQLSCSWSGGGPDPASEQAFLQMAAQGQTFFNATGDADAFTGVVQFPCASPNVTQVGGTTLTTDTNGNYLSECAWNRYNGIGGGGGICPEIPIPAWQLGLDLSANQGSSIWRNDPDVALNAENVYLLYNGQNFTEAGTSCAAPLWAGLAALVNQQAAQCNQPPVGFLNGALYGLCRTTNYAAAFHDITTGDNTSAASPTNYYAVPGYDLCTGWGTPTGTNLINLLDTPDTLGVLPQNFFFTTAPSGGQPLQTNWMFTITNAGACPVDWSLATLTGWLQASAGAGTLPPAAATNITLQLAGAAAWPDGSNYGVVTLTNLDLARVQNVVVGIVAGGPIAQNGGFETGDFTGWSLVGETVDSQNAFNMVTNGFGYDWGRPGVVHSGYFGALLGQDYYEATLSQTVNTTPGQLYLVSFWLNNNRVSAPTQQFDAFWDGTNYLDILNPPMFDWTGFQFLAAASATNTVLMFGAENDPDYFGFDDVSVEPVPPVALADGLISTNGFQMDWASVAGLNYRVQFKNNLSDPCWHDLQTVTATGGQTRFSDPCFPGHAGRRFYQIVLLSLPGSPF